MSTTVDILDAENEATEAAAPLTFDVPTEERQLREIARAPKEKQPAVAAAAQAKAKSEGRKAATQDFREAAEKVCVPKRPAKPLKPDQVKGEPEPAKPPRKQLKRGQEPFWLTGQAVGVKLRLVSSQSLPMQEPQRCLDLRVPM